MARWTQADVDRLQCRSAPVVSKYRNVKTVSFDGQKFDSKREAARWMDLKARQYAGEIRALERQVPLDLLAPTPARDACLVVATYIADFVYIDCATGKQVVEDAKGTRTQLYLLKRKWIQLQDGIIIQEV